jgi:hypothetical protein
VTNNRYFNSQLPNTRSAPKKLSRSWYNGSMASEQKTFNEKRIYADLSDGERRQLKAIAALERKPLMTLVGDACREYVGRKSNPQIATTQENA